MFLKTRDVPQEFGTKEDVERRLLTCEFNIPTFTSVLARPEVEKPCWHFIKSFDGEHPVSEISTELPFLINRLRRLRIGKTSWK